jgi:hypothetical protein
MLRDLDGDRDLDLAVTHIDPAGILILLNTSGSFSADCNENGVPDSCDITGGTSADRETDGIPDECEEGTLFHRGDANDDGRFNISDPIFILAFAFLGAQAPTCLEAADANGDTELTITDPIYILGHLFLGGPPPPRPGPVGSSCGPSAVGPGGGMGCVMYRNCL